MLQGQAKMIVESGREDGLDDETILKRMQDKLGMARKEEELYLEQYGRQTV